MKAVTTSATRIDAIRSGQPWISPHRGMIHSRGEHVIHTSPRTRRDGGERNTNPAAQGQGRLHGIARLEQIIRASDVTPVPRGREWASDGLVTTANERVLTSLDVTPDEYLWLFGPTVLFTEPVPWPGGRALTWQIPATAMCPVCGYPVIASNDPMNFDEHSWDHLLPDAYEKLAAARRVL